MCTTKELEHGGAGKTKSSRAFDLPGGLVQVLFQGGVAEEDLARKNLAAVCQTRIVVGAITSGSHVSSSPLNSAEELQPSCSPTDGVESGVASAAGGERKYL